MTNSKMKMLKKWASYAAVAIVATTSYGISWAYADEINSDVLTATETTSLDDLMITWEDQVEDMVMADAEPNTLTDDESEIELEWLTSTAETSPTPILISEPVKTISDSKELNGKYIGNGYVLIGNTKVKVVSKYLDKAVEGSEVTLSINGTLRSFKLKSITIDGTTYPAKVTSNVTEKAGLFQNGIFEVSGNYSNGKISFVSGETTKVRTLQLKNAAEYEGKLLSFKIKGTINSFKVVSPITVIESWK